MLQKSELSELSEKIIRAEERLVASNNALFLAKEAIEKRLESMNEFRSQLNSQAASFVTKKELDLVLERINNDKRSDISIWFSILALVVGISGVVANFFK